MGHNKLGNISELGGRKSLKGKGFEQAVEGIHDGGSGDMAFISQSTGKILYANYEPVGINNWSVTLGVTEEVALAGTRGISFAKWSRWSVWSCCAILPMSPGI